MSCGRNAELRALVKKILKKKPSDRKLDSKIRRLHQIIDLQVRKLQLVLDYLSILEEEKFYSKAFSAIFDEMGGRCDFFFQGILNKLSVIEFDMQEAKNSEPDEIELRIAMLKKKLGTLIDELYEIGDAIRSAKRE